MQTRVCFVENPSFPSRSSQSHLAGIIYYSIGPQTLAPSLSKLQFAGNLQIENIQNVKKQGSLFRKEPRVIDTAVSHRLIKNTITHPRDGHAENNDSTNPKTEFKLAVCHTSDVVHILGMDIIRFLQLYSTGLIHQHQSRNQTKTQW